MWKLPVAWRDLVPECHIEKPWQKCQRLREDDVVIYPPDELVFRAFEEVAPQNVKVVILGQDPYPDGSATGLCFSVLPNRTTNKSLKNVMNALSNQGFAANTTELDAWASEGVLLLNTALTVSKGRPGAHMDVWSDFTNSVLTHLKQRPQPIVWFLWGRPAEAAYDTLNVPAANHLVLRAVHPSPRNGDRFVEQMKRHPCFTEANEFLTQHGVTPVDWNLQ